MLLKSQEVSYCQLVRQVGTDSEIINGVRYKGNLFAQGNSYNKYQRDIAIHEMRRCFLDPEPPTACLLVEDGDIVTIWYEDRNMIKVVETTQDIVQYINLEQLAYWMRSDDGVELEKRWYNLLGSHQYFLGHNAISWMLSKLPINREEAKAIGQRLLDGGWIKQLPIHHQNAKSIGKRLIDEGLSGDLGKKDSFLDGNILYYFSQ
jgi:hypothetical protein